MTKSILKPMILASLFAAMAPITAHADDEADRLRDALRSATAQTRQLEDERTALQGKIADAERAASAAKQEVQKLRKEQRETIEQFNKRLAERDETLEKWKNAYEEAATVARSKDAERAKFESEAATYKASDKACQGKNTQMYKAGHELLQQYKAITVGDTIVNREPALALRRVETQNLIQAAGDKLLDQKVTQ